MAILCAAITCTPADAADKIGSSPEPNSGGVNCPVGGTIIQATSAGNAYAAPYDGVITSWSNFGNWPTLTFKLARVGTGGNFTVIASDGPRTNAAFPPRFDTYPVRFAVRQGDVIGAYVPEDDYPCFDSADPSFTRLRQSADVPAGSSSSGSSNTGTIPIEAMIERDHDGDGYGDETQDGCPTNAATHGACPLPTPIGQNFVPGTSPGPNNLSYVVTGSPGVVSTAHTDGVITSWSFQASTYVTGSVKLKMFRPLGLNDYLAVGASEPMSPVASTLNTAPTRIPVRQGDKIGIHTNGIGVTSPGGGPENSYASLAEDLAAGSSATFAPSGGVGRKIDVSAVLEADADADGFGDSSQDLCPTDASTQGACPVVGPPIADPIVPPADDLACEKARKKLKKLKAKLAKLKDDDAKAKKIESGKKKVKRAKKAVKKAC